MCRGPKPEVPHTARFRGPWNFNAVPNTVVGLTVCGFAKNLDSGAAQQPSVSLLGTTPSYGECYLYFPSDARPCFRDSYGYSPVRQMLPNEDVGLVAEALRHQ